MKYKRIFLIISLACIEKNQAMAQSIQSSEKLLPNIMSPEVASLGKYGSYSVNYYTGSPNISIPLHQINENGVSIPITLSYDASGFVPNKNASMVGLNWNLFAGGAITRVVNGIPDDSYNTDLIINPDPFGNDKGYIYGQLQMNLPHYDTGYIRKIEFLNDPDQSNHSLNDDDYYPRFSLQYEYAPDIFSFNFLGHSGKFFLDNNGVVQVSSDRRYKVNLSQLNPIFDFKTNLGIYSGSTSANLLNTSNISTITIISDDGYEFTFGGAFKDLEVQFSYDDPTDREVNSKTGTINAWYLTKVKTPEGIDFLFKNYEYNDDDAEVIKRLFDPPGYWDTIPASFLEVKIFSTQQRSSIFDANGSGQSSTGDKFGKSLTKYCYLKQIKTENYTANFSYLEKDQVNRFYGGQMGSMLKNLNYYTLRLGKMEIFDNFNGGGIPDSYQPYANSKFITFSYANKAAINGYGNRLFLNGINLNGANYSFGYSNAENLPDPITKGIDIWGYYNGKDDNSNLVGNPDVAYGTVGEYEVDLQSAGHDRRAYANVALNGMLSSITYPTGGKTEFVFENHEYGKVLKRKVSSGIVPVWETSTGIAGGLRVKEITNIPGTTTTFKYKLGYENGPNGLSSGLLIKNDIYKKDFTSNPGNIERIVSENNISAASTYSESHIGYKEVVEITSEGFTKYEFTNHESNPDIYDLGNDSYKITTERSITQFNNQLLRLFKYSSRNDERSKVSKQSVYNSTGDLLRSMEYQYNTDPSRLNARTLGIYVPHSLRWKYLLDSRLVGLIHSYALYYYHNLPTSITEKDYSNNPSIPLVTETTMQYKSNTNPLLTQKTVTQSDGTVLKYQYEYPEDYPSVQPYADMVSLKNILTPVVKETISKNSNVLFVNKHNYGVFNSNLYKIISEKQINQVVAPSLENGLMTAMQYSQRGMIEEARKDNDHLLAYLWDYKGQYPVAKVANAAYATIGYASFEADGTGRWTFQTAGILYNYAVPAGKRCYKLSGSNTLVYNHNASSQHIVSYWSKNGQYNVSGTSVVVQGATINGWTVFDHEVSGVSSVSITGTGLIDEVRIYPKGALMTTYTYEPLSGITSQCDPNNRIIYYEYDIMGRLVLIRDQDRKIVKRYCYNLYGQAENCAMETDATWTQTGETRCKPCINDPLQVTNIFQRQYLDVNFQSATYNQLTWIDDPTNTSCTGSSTTADWQNVGTPVCQLSGGSSSSDYNTGYVEQQQQDMNTCSATYGQTQTVLIYNPTLCPPPACGPVNCSGNEKKCINGFCETGTWSVISSVYISKNNWQCTWAYCFSDGSTSTYTQTTTSSISCAITCL